MQAGVAGDSATGGSSKANNPQFWAWLYDPAAPQGKRTRQLARSPIARMYHSTAALTPEGTVLVAGCDRCAYFKNTTWYSASPTGLPEYRVEVFYPPYYYATDKPQILYAPSAITFNQRFNVSYDTTVHRVPVSGVVLAAPSSTTHSTNFNQRVVGLRILRTDADRGTLLVQGPPDKNIAIPGARARTSLPTCSARACIRAPQPCVCVCVCAHGVEACRVTIRSAIRQ